MAVQTITYDDKQYLNENVDIPATNKVQDTDMNEIKSVVNNNANETTLLQEGLQDLGFYSSTEVNTGKKWVDGKTIYRKCFEITPSSGGGTYPTGITNLDKVTHFESLPIYSGGTYSDGFYNGPTDYARIYISSDGTQFNPRSDGSSLPLWRITLEYTKTND